MMKYSVNTVGPDITQVLSEDSERVFCRAWRLDDDGRLVGAAAAERSKLRCRSINRSPNLQHLASGCSATGLVASPCVGGGRARSAVDAVLAAWATRG
jgi:hypothetical protein